MDARFKRGDEVYLKEDRGKTTRIKYRITEYFLGDIPMAYAHLAGNKNHDTADDHNYLIESVGSGAQKAVGESEVEGPAKG